MKQNEKKAVQRKAAAKHAAKKKTLCTFRTKRSPRGERVRAKRKELGPTSRRHR